MSDEKLCGAITKIQWLARIRSALQFAEGVALTSEGFSDERGSEAKLRRTSNKQLILLCESKSLYSQRTFAVSVCA